METRKYYRTYTVVFGENIDMENEDALTFQCYIIADDKGKKQGKGKKEKTEEQKKAKEEKRAAELAANPANALVMATLGGANYNAEINKELPIKKKKKEKEIVYAVDRDLDVLAILVKGIKGE